ncbi:Uncharacterised protein [Bordetella pertussis]|nr:Uncharacterised protein [Bordetella pertussis]CFT89919.1 Uncharacterised protein [Bordetella pertussis]CFV98858.1 Uncharacterised protein [Bordetella pertussis]CRE32799.1 Uncharacterised protein [Bordetella pertussis]
MRRGWRSNRARFSPHTTAYSSTFSANSQRPTDGKPSEAQASDTMPVAMTMPKLAGDSPASKPGFAGAEEGASSGPRGDMF